MSAEQLMRLNEEESETLWFIGDNTRWHLTRNIAVCVFLTDLVQLMVQLLLMAFYSLQFDSFITVRGVVVGVNYLSALYELGVVSMLREIRDEYRRI